MNPINEVTGKPHIVINGKVWEFWEQFVHNKGKFIGMTMQDLDTDPIVDCSGTPTVIKDIIFRENGERSAWFALVGQDYEWGADVSVLHVGATDDGLMFHGFGHAQCKVSIPGGIDGDQYRKEG